MITPEIIAKEKKVWKELGDESLRLEILQQFQEKGVHIPVPQQTYIQSTVTIGQGTIVLPNVFIFLESQIGEGCILWPNTVIIASTIGNKSGIESFCKLEKSIIGNRVTIRSHTKIAGSTLGDECKVGPQACLGPGSVINPGEDIGRISMKNGMKT
jgi:bifunctional UDP-N-acetylglucosamine pyrophosphorylase/glucosamine-1-phosphate N-acetyltransferase